MANPLIRQHFIARIEATLAKSRAVAGLEHDGLKGSARETFVEELLRPVLPAGLQSASGIVTDVCGGQSKQCDIVIYDRSRIAPALWDASSGLIPMDAVFAVVEVKSVLTASEIDKCIGNAQSLKRLAMMREDEVQPTPVLHAVFALATDLKTKNELDRLTEHDSGALINPSTKLWCIAGAGFWFHRGGCWQESPADSEHNEVIDFLGVLANTAARGLTRARMGIGAYVVEPRDWTRINQDGSRELVKG